MIRREAAIFLVVGTLTVVVDFSSYQSLIWAGVGHSFAKAFGFIAGTIFAYFANKYWTFSHARQATNSVPRFAALYAITLGVNVLVNQGVLNLMGFEALWVTLAFVLATGVSAVLNFMGMKFFVFYAGREHEQK